MLTQAVTAVVAPLMSSRLWSTSEVGDKPAKFTIVPTLKLRGAGGRTVVARNVLLFRVDNLEGEAMGQAIVVREWDQSV